MKRSSFASFLTAAVLAIGTVPALAQESRPSNSPGEQAGSRPSNGSGGSGTAVSRPSGGGGGGSSSGGGSSAGSSSSGSSGMSTPSNGGGSSIEFRESRPRAPERRAGDYAVPRGGNDSFNGGRSSVGRAPSPASSTSSVAGVDASSDQRRAVPAYSRPRDGRAVIGQAVERPVSPDGGLGNPINIVYYPYPYYPYYDSYYGYPGRYGYGYGWGPWYGGYGFGLGYFYDPFGYYGYYSPYNDDYGYSSGSGSGRYSYSYGRETGQLRLKVNPKHGQVYVDGYFAGEVDNFDGTFQRLAIEAGSHKVEIRAEGFETASFDVMITPGETVTYKGELKKAIR